ncbi:M28 family metallopeptidase [Gemmatimonadota bacterium]
MRSPVRFILILLVLLAIVLVTLAGFRLFAQESPSGLSAITMEDLEADLIALADDDFLGREAGTENELRAAAWLAQRAREAGLEPAGEDGSYFQFFPLRRMRVSGGSLIRIGDVEFRIWEDANVLSPVETTVEGELVWVGDTPPEEIDGGRVSGRPVAAMILPPSLPPAPDVRLWEWRYSMAAVRERSRDLVNLGATAVVLVADEVTDVAFDLTAGWQMRGRTRGDTPAAQDRAEGSPPVIWIRGDRVGDVSQGQMLRAEISTESFLYPSANVVATVPGSDPELGGEYVLFSGHHDHDGVRWPVAGDSIYNGADDNATACVALLAIGRAFAENPGRRGALFVWHGAEEKGLIGSRWYAQNPTVPPSSIKAVLNADMIARNHPDSAAILGMLPPHRNSSDLVEMALAANDAVGGFALDTLWDQPDHPEGFYFRSDHAPYAQAGIPALFYTSLLHADYHTPKDETEALDFEKLLRFTRWMYATGWAVAQAEQAPRIDEGWEYRR